MKIHSQKELAKTLIAIDNDKQTDEMAYSRRGWLAKFGATAASGAFLYACGSDSKNSVAVAAQDDTADAATFNAALDLEHEAIAIYTAAAGLSIWDKHAKGSEFLDVARCFLAHHTSHRATLTTQITDAKGTAAATQTTAAYLARNGNPTLGSDLATLVAVLKLALKLEMQAAQAYASLAAKLSLSARAGVFANLAADEATHYAVFRAAFVFVVPDTTVGTAATIIPGAMPADWKVGV